MQRHSAYTSILSCSREIHLGRGIDTFGNYIKPTINLRFSIVSTQDILFMSTEFQDWQITSCISPKVSTTCNAETDG